jgi:hypothetical protein
MLNPATSHNPIPLSADHNLLRAKIIDFLENPSISTWCALCDRLVASTLAGNEQDLTHLLNLANCHSDFPSRFGCIPSASPASFDEASVRLLGKMALALFDVPVPQAKMISDAIRLFECDAFLASYATKHLVSASTAKLAPSKILTQEGQHSLATDRRRSSEYTWATSNADPLIALIIWRISRLVNSDLANSEYLTVIRYNVGDHLEPHFDTVKERPSMPSPNDGLDRFGRRAISVIGYLNDDFTGGRTRFPVAGKDVSPKAGNAIFFFNQHENGLHNDATLHESEIVSQGEKWIFVTWFREERIIRAAAHGVPLVKNDT